MCWSDIVFADPGDSAPNAAGYGSSRDILHPDAARARGAAGSSIRRHGRRRRKIVSPPRRLPGVPKFRVF